MIFITQFQLLKEHLHLWYNVCVCVCAALSETKTILRTPFWQSYAKQSLLNVECNVGILCKQRMVLLVFSWSCLHWSWDLWKSSRSFCSSFPFSFRLVCSFATWKAVHVLKLAELGCCTDFFKVKFICSVFQKNLFHFHVVFLVIFLFQVFKLQRPFFDCENNDCSFITQST